MGNCKYYTGYYLALTDLLFDLQSFVLALWFLIIIPLGMVAWGVIVLIRFVRVFVFKPKSDIGAIEKKAEEIIGQRRYWY
jgi:hypothetical protein